MMRLFSEQSSCKMTGVKSSIYVFINRMLAEKGGPIGTTAAEKEEH